jgi:hypothetical protein
MNVPNKVIVHCADTPNGKVFTVEDIDGWHFNERRFKRSAAARAEGQPELKGIGYHYVIYVDGSVHQGRNENEVGAHCQGANTGSIGVCLIGKDKFTQEQWDTLKVLVETKGLPVFGHYQFDSAKAQGKTCPNFEVQTWVVDGHEPTPGHIL